ncbi:MAG TPA: hypothetical protein V6D25_12740 [Leptolyngbyaceae cyanobacterium]
MAMRFRVMWKIHVQLGGHLNHDQLCTPKLVIAVLALRAIAS